MPIFTLGKPFEGGHLDTLEVEPSGEMHVYGWTRDPRMDPGVELSVDGALIRPHERFRLSRHDVESLFPSSGSNLGFGFAYHAPEQAAVGTIEVRISERTIARVDAQTTRTVPHYAHLFDEARVLHRDDIYSYGPPTKEADPCVLAFARSLPAPILDLGCGSGALVRALRAAGVEAEGIELSRRDIVDSLRNDIRPFVRLYDGGFPLPYSNLQFGSVICSEVLEHIADWQTAIQELARIARRALITVPDMSAIPTLFPHRVVPWHLMESTHVNFFTQRSLHTTLSRVFQSITFFRLGEFWVNGTRVFTSLVASCER